MLRSHSFVAVNHWCHSHLSIRWVITRDIRVTQILVNPDQRNTIPDRTLQSTGIISVQFVSSDDEPNSNIQLARDESKYLQTIHLGGCEGITHIGASALGHVCRQLQSIDLSGCQGITDIGVSELGRGFDPPRSINLIE
jgi:Leucine Rich repeat